MRERCTLMMPVKTRVGEESKVGFTEKEENGHLKYSSGFKERLVRCHDIRRRDRMTSHSVPVISDCYVYH